MIVTLTDISVLLYVPVCFIILFIHLFQIEAVSVLHIPPQSYDATFIVSFILFSLLLNLYDMLWRFLCDKCTY